MNFDPHLIPVSVPQSFLVLNGVGEHTPPWHRREAATGIYLRSMRLGGGQCFIFRLHAIVDGVRDDSLTWVGSPGAIECRSGANFVNVRFCGTDELIFTGQGMGLCLEAYPGYFDYIRPMPENRWRYSPAFTCTIIDLSPLHGRITVDAPWNATHSDKVLVDCKPADDGTWKLHLCEKVAQSSPSLPTVIGSLDAALEFKQWSESLVSNLENAPVKDLAVHSLWSTQAGHSLLLPPGGTFASKGWMNTVYTWDTCFQALSVAHGQPENAWSQFSFFFRLQTEDGCLPGSVQPNRKNFLTVLPPIQGWTLTLLRQIPGVINRERLAWLYPRLVKWTQFWLVRDEDGDGLPEYWHGNDSGWDNGSVFSLGVPVLSPDLITYLVLQCEALATAATDLGLTTEAAGWQTKADELVQRLIARCWDGKRLRPRLVYDARTIPGESLLELMPLLLGDRLPGEIKQALIEQTARPGAFLAPFGPATEALDSPLYASDSYWRGCVWPSSTLLLAAGLKRSGATELAEQALRGFIRGCDLSGLSENHDPITGQGWRDRHYAWAGAVYILAQRWLQGLWQP